MFKDRLGVRSVVALLIFTLVVSAFGFVAAQDNSAAPFLGVGLSSTDTTLKVEQVQTGSPADKAGVKIGDIITAIDTKAVTADTIRDVIAGHKVGDVVTLSLTRGTSSMDVKVTLGERPAEATEAPSAPTTIAPTDIAPTTVAPSTSTSGDHPVLGIQLENTDNGPVIRAVMPGSPAEKAGLKVDDVLTKIGDTAVKDAQSASAAVQTHKVGDDVAIEVTRAGKTVTVTATLAAGSTVTAPSAPSIPSTANRPLLGVQLQDTDKGVVIQAVGTGSPAETAGLKVGDVLTKIGDIAVTDAASASAAVRALKVGDEVSIEVTRDAKTVTVKATLAAASASAFGLSQNGMGITYDGTSKQWSISSLPQDSDLYKAGLREGDKITQFDGTAYDPAALSEYLSKATADVTLTVTRDGKDQEIKVPATALMGLAMGGFGMGSGEMPFFDFPFNMMGGGSRLGVEFVTLDASVAKEHNVTATVGALVTKVSPQSPADKAGIKANDVVTKVDGSEVNAEHTLRDLLVSHKAGDSIKLDVVHDGKSSQLSV
ncbi:MAG: PDZ domain-containing protein, partial [Chloroflexota bacterium]